jgi:hypothetical protein
VLLPGRGASAEIGATKQGGRRRPGDFTGTEKNKHFPRRVHKRNFVYDNSIAFADHHFVGSNTCEFGAFVPMGICVMVITTEGKNLLLLMKQTEISLARIRRHLDLTLPEELHFKT